MVSVQCYPASLSYCNVEIHDSFVVVIGDVGRLDSHVGNVYGSREKEENRQSRQQQTKGH